MVPESANAGRVGRRSAQAEGGGIAKVRTLGCGWRDRQGEDSWLRLAARVLGVGGGRFRAGGALAAARRRGGGVDRRSAQGRGVGVAGAKAMSELGDSVPV